MLRIYTSHALVVARRFSHVPTHIIPQNILQSLPPQNPRPPKMSFPHRKSWIRRNYVLELASVMGILIKLLVLDPPNTLDARPIVGPEFCGHSGLYLVGWGARALGPPPIEIPSRSRVLHRPTSTLHASESKRALPHGLEKPTVGSSS